MNLFDSGAR